MRELPVKELREVIALAEGGRLTPIPIERVPLERINDVYARLKRGEIQRLQVKYGH